MTRLPRVWEYVVILTYIDKGSVQVHLWPFGSRLGGCRVFITRSSLADSHGAVGSSGRSTGPHLHFQTDIGSQWGTHVNPHVYLGGKGGVTSSQCEMMVLPIILTVSRQQYLKKRMWQTNVIVDTCLKGKKTEEMFLLFPCSLPSISSGALSG